MGFYEAVRTLSPQVLRQKLAGFLHWIKAQINRLDFSVGYSDSVALDDRECVHAAFSALVWQSFTLKRWRINRIKLLGACTAAIEVATCNSGIRTWTLWALLQVLAASFASWFPLTGLGEAAHADARPLPRTWETSTELQAAGFGLLQCGPCSQVGSKPGKERALFIFLL